MRRDLRPGVLAPMRGTRGSNSPCFADLFELYYCDLAIQAYFRLLQSGCIAEGDFTIESLYFRRGC
jgi:hypothetical protein